MKLMDIPRFKGGNDAQRTHLNDLIDQVNDLTKEVARLAALTKILEGKEDTLTYCEENGEVVARTYPSQKVADILA